MKRGGTSAKCLQITGWGLYRIVGILKIINFYHTAAGPGMGMWVDERGRKVSESFQNFKIGQIEGWRILHKYSNQGKCSESGILEPEKTSFG